MARNIPQYPEPFPTMEFKRFGRHLGKRAGLSNFDVIITRIAPGACISRFPA